MQRVDYHDSLIIIIKHVEHNCSSTQISHSDLHTHEHKYRYSHRLMRHKHGVTYVQALTFFWRFPGGGFVT